MLSSYYHVVRIQLFVEPQVNSEHLEKKNREYVFSCGFAVTFNRLLIRAFVASGWY